MGRALHRAEGRDSQQTVGISPPLRRRSGSSRSGLLVGFMAVALLSPLVADRSHAQESRCLELGQSCECSEPMDTTATSIGHQHQFADSPPAYGCDKFQSYFGTNKTNIRTTPETGMPAGNSVDRVVEIPAAGASIVWLRGRMTVDDSIKRTCIRYYKQVTTDYSGVGPNNISCPSERNKIIQFQFGGTQVQLQERADGSVCTGPGTGNDYEAITITNPAGFGNTNLSPRVDWGDCWNTNGWCRIEMCASGDLSRGQNINFEANVRTLKDGVDHYGNQGRLWNPGTGMKADSAGDLYHGQGQGGKGTEWISHFMQASWTTNQGQWIGAAYEIEGGGGSPPPDPPDPPDPPAPVAPLAPTLLPPDEVPPPTGQTGTLTATLSTTGGAPTATSVVTNGVGPYLFLFDCGLDGNWNGVLETSGTTDSHTCPAGTGAIKAQVWDKGSNEVMAKTLTVTN